jgi:hypothetical protein
MPAIYPLLDILNRKMDGCTANAKVIRGFGDRVFFPLHALALYHNSSRVEQHKGCLARPTQVLIV